ncbi:MAG: hypothetical protein ABIT76_00715 [Chthoniobacterales bacterium]
MKDDHNYSKILDVIVFTCEGREKLLEETWQAFSSFFPKEKTRIILAIDGEIAPNAITAISPNVIVRNFRRSGYIRSIINALRLVESEFFYWLEDDWTPMNPLDVDVAIAGLLRNPKWIQARWSKTAPLTAEDYILEGDFNFSSVGFSANPCVCRTDLIRKGFYELSQSKKGSSLGIDGFENFLTNWALENNLPCAVMNPGETPAVEHSGYLESTGREWHMTSSLDKRPAQHLSPVGSPPLWRRLWMIPKLIRSAIVVGIRQIMDDEAYNLAFRIVGSRIQLKKEQADKKRTRSMQ